MCIPARQTVSFRTDRCSAAPVTQHTHGSTILDRDQRQQFAKSQSPEHASRGAQLSFWIASQIESVWRIRISRRCRSSSSSQRDRYQQCRRKRSANERADESLRRRVMRPKLNEQHAEEKGSMMHQATGDWRGTPARPAGDTPRYAQPFQQAVARIHLSKAAGCREGRSVVPVFRRRVRTGRASA